MVGGGNQHNRILRKTHENQGYCGRCIPADRLHKAFNFNDAQVFQLSFGYWDLITIRRNERFTAERPVAQHRFLEEGAVAKKLYELLRRALPTQRPKSGPRPPTQY
jgi:hypothetical protein